MSWVTQQRGGRLGQVPGAWPLSICFWGPSVCHVASLLSSSLRLPYRAGWSVAGYASLRPAPGDPHRLRDLWRGQRVVSAALRFASDGTLWLETTEGSFVLASELTLLRSADTLAPRPMPEAPVGWYTM